MMATNQTTKRASRSIYMDHAATTPLDPAVLKAMLPYFGKHFGNPSALYGLGRKARAAVEQARETVASILSAKPEEIIFTGSGTESDNLAIFGVAEAAAAANRGIAHNGAGKHIIISTIEHKAVLEAAQRLEKKGFEVTQIGVDAQGIIKMDELRKALRPDTVLVSVMYANNEIGTIQPIAEIAKLIKTFRTQQATADSPTSNSQYPIFHTDACQAAGALPLDINALGVDLLTLNGGKIYGPKGVGCLYVRRGVVIEPQIVGGGQERNMRGGTENVPLIVGFATALKLAQGAEHKREHGRTGAKAMQKNNAQLTALRDYFIERLLASIPKTKLNGHPTKRLPNNVNVSIFGIEGEAMLLMLDRLGISASTGSACAARSLMPSHVLLAIGLSPEWAHGSLRFTLGHSTTKADIDRVLAVLPKIVTGLRKISSIKT